ncbi:MAG: polysaccharide deacetylase family protein [Bacteroidota bacterium]|nr:polysaccharide deacetylase family protein [Bacteroidota bacterium]
MRLPVRPPYLLRKLYPGAIWRMNKTEKKIYLTFDDGPVPGVTPEALSVLKTFGVKATFFCVGNNVEKHPEIYQQVIAEGHTTANHTFNHVDGWNTSTKEYLSEVAHCTRFVSSGLFRPPYGRMRPPQRKAISGKYSIILWDVLTYDFDKTLTGETCLQLALKNSREGSIVVFHDSEKAKERMLYALPKYIEEMKARGFEFGVL